MAMAKGSLFHEPAHVLVFSFNIWYCGRDGKILKINKKNSSWSFGGQVSCLRVEIVQEM